MASATNVRNFANRIRNSRSNTERARARFDSSTNNAGSWWQDDAFPVFVEGKQTTVREANDLIGAMATLQSKFENLAEQLRRAEEERREERREARRRQ